MSSIDILPSQFMSRFALYLGCPVFEPNALTMGIISSMVTVKLPSTSPGIVTISQFCL
jgi:hypothetical protein